MITLNIDLLLQAKKAVKSKQAEVLAARDKQYRSKVLAMYKELLYVSPQFSGDFVSNWDIETPLSNSRAYKEIPGKNSVAISQQPHEAGDKSPELDSAYMRGVSRMRYVTYGQPVYFTNPTPIQISSPEVIGPDGKRNDLRDSTVITAWESIHSYLQSKYGSTF
jgi:hypothetical protein